MLKLSSTAATVRITPCGDVLEFAFFGVLTRAAMEEAFTRWQCVTHSHGESAYIARVDTALWVSGDGECFAGLVSGTGPWMTRPSAVVVQPGNEAWFRRLALAQAARGVVLGVFTCAEQASAWVRRRAQAFSPRQQAPLRIQSLAGSAHKRAAAAHHPLSHQAVSLHLAP